MAQTPEEFLAHYGILGMKWGVRRTPEQLSQARGRRKADQKIKSKRRQQYANRRQLSDADLTRFIRRLEQEKKLKDLTSSEITPGKTFVQTITTNAAKTALTAALAGAVGYAIRAALTKEFNAKEAATYIVRAPKK